MEHTQNSEAVDRMFMSARSQNGWQDKPVDVELLKKIQELAQMGPTSVNCQPSRLVFLVTLSAKERIKPMLAPGNVEKTMTAPVVTIVAYDLDFVETLPSLFPHKDMREMFAGKADMIESTAFRNGTLQGAYLLLAARALGLDCGPMSGFDNKAVDQEFFKGTNIRSNFLLNLGHGDPAALFPQSPRLGFDEIADVL
ncbi:MAG: malonic semialdehyde reductase [Pseudomonadota bacterium]